MLRRLFGPETEEVAGGWRKLRNEELHNVYASANFISVTDEIGAAYSTHGIDEKFCSENVKERTTWKT
jgi:hypothetical protein